MAAGGVSGKTLTLRIKAERKFLSVLHSAFIQKHSLSDLIYTRPYSKHWMYRANITVKGPVFMKFPFYRKRKDRL